MPSAIVLAHPELPAPRPADQAWIVSFLRSIRSRATRPAAEKTVNVYRLALRLLARWAVANDRPELPGLKRADLEDYVIWMRTVARKRNGEPYSEGYVSNQYRAVKSFYTWLAEEEEIANPTAKMKAPKVTEKTVPLISDEDMLLLLKSLEKDKGFEGRRDLAIVRMFFCTGLRIEELTTILFAHLDLDHNRVTVDGKNDKYRVVRFDIRTAAALDRYLRMRGKHRFAGENPYLWLPTMHRRRPLTPHGIRCMIRRRASAVGMRINPHMFRHTFSSNFLARGGQEQDLMEQNGWTTPQMLSRYGRVARSQRMQSNYDKIMGPGL